MKQFIKNHKMIAIICVCLGYWANIELSTHYRNKNLCAGTQYKIINKVTYCDHEGTLVKPKEYKRLIK